MSKERKDKNTVENTHTYADELRMHISHEVESEVKVGFVGGADHRTTTREIEAISA